MTTRPAQPETIAFLDYLEERATTKHVSAMLAELLERLGKLAPPVRVQKQSQQRRAS